MEKVLIESYLFDQDEYCFWDIVIDNNDNIIAVGSFGTNAVIVKLSTNKDILWEKKFSPEKGHIYAVGIDSGNNIIAVGNIQNNYLDAFIVKLDEAGNVIWEKRFKNEAHSEEGYDSFEHVVIDQNDNIIVAGSRYDGSAWNGYMVSLSFDGNILWETSFSGQGSISFNSITIGRDGCVIATGCQYGSFEEGVFIVKVKDGNVL